MILCSFSTFAFKRGFYIDADVGAGVVNYDHIPLVGSSQPTSIDGSGIAPRVVVGYDVYRYLSAEFGVIYFNRPKFYGVHTYAPTQHVYNTKHNLVQLLLKASLPLGNFDINARGGIGYIVRNTFNIKYNDGNIQALQSGSFIVPVFGVGADYRISPHWGLELVWLHAPPIGRSQIPSSNFYGLGAFYKF